MEKVRAIFIYLSIIAVILGIIGVAIMSKNPTGLVTQNVNKYNEKEIAMHNTQENCWISYNMKVYDITLFLQVYKDENLKEKCGEDVGNYFLNTEKVLNGYEIGVLVLGED